MPDINSAFPSKYLKASDLGSNQPLVTIERVAFEPVGRDREMKPVLYFQGKEKGVVLNKTNGTKIAQIAGSTMTEDWAGVQVCIYATETEFGGETVECIRVKAPKRAAAPRVVAVAPPPPEPQVDDAPLMDDSDIPF